MSYQSPEDVRRPLVVLGAVGSWRPQVGVEVSQLDCVEHDQDHGTDRDEDGQKTHQLTGWKRKKMSEIVQCFNMYFLQIPQAYKYLHLLKIIINELEITQSSSYWEHIFFSWQGHIPYHFIRHPFSCVELKRCPFSALIMESYRESFKAKFNSYRYILFYFLPDRPFRNLGPLKSIHEQQKNPRSPEVGALNSWERIGRVAFTFFVKARSDFLVSVRTLNFYLLAIRSSCRGTRRAGTPTWARRGAASARRSATSGGSRARTARCTASARCLVSSPSCL